MDKHVQILAGGGGSADDEAEILSHFVTLVGVGGRVLYVPWAATDPGDPALADWAITALGVHGLSKVNVASTVKSHREELSASDGVFLGGGNTYRLLQRLRATGFGSQLVDEIRAGKPCYGGSAGAIVLGAHIGTCSHMDENVVGLDDLAALNLFGGQAIWCHYSNDDAELIRLFVKSTGIPVLSIPENAGLWLNSKGVSCIGPGEARYWSADGSWLVPTADLT